MGSIFACYSIFLKKYKEAPADYDKEIKNRFPPQKVIKI